MTIRYRRIFTTACFIFAQIWPRLSALAERLWTNPLSDWNSALFRLVHHRTLLTMRGVAAEGIQPEWCHQMDGGCPAWGEQ